MDTSHEEAAPKTPRKRRLLPRVMLLTVLILVLSLLALWFWVTQPLFISSSAVSLPPADPARLEAHVRALSQGFFPRHEARPDNLERAAQYIRAEFERAGAASVAEQPFEADGRTYRNVVARFGPEGGGRVVVGAHYDAAGPLPGADDNASGVAGLLELARLLGQQAPPARVDLVAYALEEPPYFRTPQMGSAVHAASLKREGADVRLMISLEMIGYFRDEEGSQQFPVSALKLFYPSRGNFISVVGNFAQGLTTRRVKSAMRSGAPALSVHSISAPASVPGVDFSDHLNYWRAGYPAVMLTDTAFYRNPNYHTSRDTADTLDYPRMAAVVQAAHAAVRDFAK